ncbi:MAG: ATP-binding protein [Bryobacteraceae bacterium]
MKRATYDRRIFWTAILCGLPGSVIALLLLWYGDYSARAQWTLGLIIVCAWLGFALSLKERVIFPLQTLSNLLAALREGDYSIRGRHARYGDTLGEVMLEVNALGATLREQRLGALEATTLLRAVMAEIEVAVFAFDATGRLKLVNRAGERLLVQPAERLLGRNAADLGLAACLEGGATRTLQMSFPGGAGRWGIRRSAFREKGLPHQLLVVSDLTRPLREEEFQAWQRLVRVLGHELNNSLAPIKSIAGSLEHLLTREPRPADWYDDMQRGLAIIAARSEALSRFTGAYARLARLPQPKLAPLEVGPWIQRVAALETRLPIVLLPGPGLIIHGDRDQLEQLLINLLHNAVEATMGNGSENGVQVRWRKNAAYVEISVEDDGPGLSNTANLFVPFFTTKPGGSGIGLVLSRQIAEAHEGSLTLENRPGGGCEAKLRLPL